MFLTLSHGKDFWITKPIIMNWKGANHQKEIQTICCYVPRLFSLLINYSHKFPTVYSEETHC